MHDALFLRGYRRRTVQDTAVVPHDQVMPLPFMGINIFGSRAPVNELLRQNPTFFNRPADDAFNMAADIQTFLASRLMRSNNRMFDRR